MELIEEQAQQQGYLFPIGIDEAGRGPLAGPVVASAVCLRAYEFEYKITDSKKLSEKQRIKAYEEIFEKAYVGVGMMSEAVIDRVNILNATYLAMTNAVYDILAQISRKEGGSVKEKMKLFIDGNQFKSDLPFAVQTIIKGDQKMKSIACASIIAKVSRDRLITKYDRIFPQYGFAKHKGYPTKAHKEAIAVSGLSPIHRRTFNSI